MSEGFGTFVFDKAASQRHTYFIKPAAPLLACVIRRVFFCLDFAPQVKGGES